MVTIAGCGRRLIGGRNGKISSVRNSLPAGKSLFVYRPRPSALISFFSEQRPVTTAKVAVTLISRRDYKVCRYDYRPYTLRFSAQVYPSDVSRRPSRLPSNSRFDNALFVTPGEISTVDRNEWIGVPNFLAYNQPFFAVNRAFL